MRLNQAESTPLPFDPARGAEARALFPDAPANMQALIEGVAGGSSYLASSIAKEQGWLASVISSDMQESFDALLVFDQTTLQSLTHALRVAKRRAALLIALADIGGLWPLEKVTAALTQLADAAVDTGLQFLVNAEHARGKLDADPHEAAGMFVIAMGKMGAFELNYSSDIDLIILFDETRHAPEKWGEVRASFIRITKQLIRLLSENTGEGYVFRTDLRLRPDASVTPVCIATEPAERYYESVGRTWERAAFIKARICAGARPAGEAFLKRLEPFVWRRQLDYAAIEDAHEMRLRIREHKGLHGKLSVPGHDVKLGLGGIREIEFFAQTQQIIGGGKNRTLRMRDTVGALKALAGQGIVPQNSAAALIEAYRAHRRLEHRIQMMDDAQTHIIPEDSLKRQQLATFAGYSDLAEFEADVTARLKQVHEITEDFFNDHSEVATPSESWNTPKRADEITQGWYTYPALRSERGRRIFNKLKPTLLASLCRAQNPDEALLEFDNFLRGLPAGVQVFSLFKANPALLNLLIDTCTTAPELGRYLGRNARVLEAMIGAEFFKPLPELGVLEADLESEVEASTDYEEQLDAVRIWAQERRFRVGVHFLRGIATAQETAVAYSRIAESCVSVLFGAVRANFAKRHGPPPGKGAAVIAMGKLGSREMTVSSDLDLIIVYDAGGASGSSGNRPLAVKPYYARFTQALVSALTVSTSKGGLYEVDMRLRPSGRQGPVATSLEAFRSYQNNEAWDWEHMALLRARVVAGTITAPVDKVISEALAKPRDPAQVLRSFHEMRQRLAGAKSGTGVWDIKNGTGGLMDLELFLQAGGIIAGASAGQNMAGLARAGWLEQSVSRSVIEALALYQGFQQAKRLSVKGVFDPDTAGSGPRQLLARVCGVADMAALEKALETTRENMTTLISEKSG